MLVRIPPPKHRDLHQSETYVSRVNVTAGQRDVK